MCVAGSNSAGRVIFSRLVLTLGIAAAAGLLLHAALHEARARGFEVAASEVSRSYFTMSQAIGKLADSTTQPLNILSEILPRSGVTVIERDGTISFDSSGMNLPRVDLNAIQLGAELTLGELFSTSGNWHGMGVFGDHADRIMALTYLPQRDAMLMISAPRELVVAATERITSPLTGSIFWTAMVSLFAMLTLFLLWHRASAREQRTRTLSSAVQEDLISLQRQSAVGRMAGGVAHDINNMVTVIHGHVSMLRHELSAGKKGAHEDHLAAVENAAHAAALLASRMLILSQNETSQRRSIKPGALIHHYTPEWSKLLGRGIKLTVSNKSKDAAVFADPLQIYQLLLNLLVNASNAMQGKGRIVIQTRVCETPPDDLVLGPVVAPCVCLSVEDSGPGVEQTVIDNLRAFQASKQPQSGQHGFGLSVVAAILNRHGGGLGIDSSEAGSSFQLYLPLYTPERFLQLDAQTDRKTSTQRSTQKPGLLVVDSADSVRDMITQTLTERGWRVRQAATLAGATRILEQDAQITTVLADVSLVDGSAQSLLGIYDDLDIVFMSSTPLSLPEDSPYLRKPFSIEDLVATLSKNT